MKKIKTTDVTSTSRQPLLGRSISHIKEGIMENDNSLLRAILMAVSSTGYTTNDVLVLHGCVNSGVNSGAGLTYTVSAGAVYYNGEIYQVAAANGTISGTNVVTLTITTTYQSGDPVTMTDGSLKNVHEIVTMDVGQGATGSGTIDFSNLDYINTYAQKIANQTTLATQTTSSTSYVDATGLSYTFTKAGKYEIEFIGYSNPSIPANNNGTNIDGGGYFQIWNNTTSAELDAKRHSIGFVAATTVSDMGNYDIGNDVPFVSKCIETFAVGDVIKCRFKMVTGGVDETIVNCKLFVKEI